MSRYLCAVLAAFALLVAGCTDTAPPEPEQQNIRPAKLLRVTRGEGRIVYDFTARIEALQSVDLSFEVGGVLRESPVREGETVQDGGLIAALDPVEFQLEVREAEVELQQATQDLNRKQQVLADYAIARSQVEDAAAEVDLRKVRLRQARERLSDSRIYAPFNAYVSQRYMDNFVNVQSGKPVVRLLDLNQLLVVMSVPENLVATASPGEILGSWVEFSFAPDREFEIVYHENRGEADSVAQTYEVSFVMDNPDDLNILPGMTATARVSVRNSLGEVMLVPASALVPTAEGALSVWVVDAATDEVEQRRIETSAPGQAGVPVTAGLQEGEQIVVSGASQLQEGMRIRALP